MKEQIMVFSKEWFEKHNKTLCWFANAPVIKYWFRWLLRIHNDIPFNTKINQITPNSFSYNAKKVGDKIELTTDFRTHEKFGKRLYYGLKPFWYLLHFWDWSTSVQPALNCGFDTLTVYPESGSGGTNVSCSGFVQIYEAAPGTTWTLLRAKSTGLNSATSQMIIGITTTGSTNWQRLFRGLSSFDTSDLTSNAAVSAAVLSLYGASKADNCNISPKINICSVDMSDTGEIALTDVGKTGNTSFSSDITYANISLSDYNTFSLNASGIATISKTGVSQFSIKEAAYDITGTEPTHPGASLQSDIRFYSADETGTTKDPKLVVTYTISTKPIVTTQSCTNIETTSCTGNGNITGIGEASPTTRGFCYKEGTTGDPTTSDSKVSDTGTFSTGAFTKSITGLTAGTSYRVRAYAVNSAGTSYGTTVQVTTLKAFKPRTMWF